MFLAVFLMLLLNLTNAHASSVQNGIIPSGFKEGYYSMGFETTDLTTSANYTQKGTSLDFDSGNAFSEFQSLLYGRYDYSNQLSFFSDLPLNYAKSESPTDNRSTFKASGLSVGANYDFKYYFFKVIAELNGYYALEKFDRSSDDALTSDGASFINVGSHFFKDFSKIQLHGYLSFEYRLEGFSSLLNYQTDVSYKGENKVFTLGLKGFQSVVDDLNTSNPNRRHDYLDVVNGSSLIHGSVNPSRLDLFTQAKFSVSEAIDLYLSVDKSIRGENSGDILTYTVGFEYFFEPVSKSKYESTHKEDFQSDDESIDPKVEERIKSYNRPSEKIVPQKLPPKPKPILKPKPPPPPPEPPTPPPRPEPPMKVKLKPATPKKVVSKPAVKRVSKPKVTSKPPLEMSKKYLGKKTTSTSPIKSKPKSKKIKRVRIDF
jgi:hypothetical protein